MRSRGRQPAPGGGLSARSPGGYPAAVIGIARTGRAALAAGLALAAAGALAADDAPPAAARPELACRVDDDCTFARVSPLGCSMDCCGGELMNREAAKRQEQEYVRRCSERVRRKALDRCTVVDCTSAFDGARCQEHRCMAVRREPGER